MRIAVNLPAHVDWAARKRMPPREVRTRLLALALGLGFVLGMAAVGQLLASAARTFEEANRPTPTVAAAAPSTPTPTPIPSSTPTPTPTPPPPPLPPDYVARMRAARLGIDHYVVRLGVINNQMQSPDADGVHAVGWYPEYGTPGRHTNAVFSAHETWELQRGPFYAMAQARAGDEFAIEMTSGARYRYQVISNRRYPEATIPMGELIWPSNQPAGEEWITLITCGGRFVVTGANGTGYYLDRDVVVAKRLP